VATTFVAGPIALEMDGDWLAESENDEAGRLSTGDDDEVDTASVAGAIVLEAVDWNFAMDDEKAGKIESEEDDGEWIDRGDDGVPTAPVAAAVMLKTAGG
jgi:hypothetical protein